MTKGNNAKDLMGYMSHLGIETRTTFFPLHKQPCYQKLAQKQFYHHNQIEMEEALQNSISADERGVCLPSYPSLEDDKIQYVCKTIKSFYNRTK